MFWCNLLEELILYHIYVFIRVIKDKLAHLDLQALLEHPVQEGPQETQGRTVPAAHRENQ